MLGRRESLLPGALRDIADLAAGARDPEHVREESAADKTNSCLGVVQEPGESLKHMF